MSDTTDSIVRVRKSGNFFVASNEPFNDERLSLEARGLMGYLLSKPDDWVTRNDDIRKRCNVGDYKLRRILGELKDCGYLVRRRHQGEDGQFTWETEIFESASLNPDYDPEESPYVGFPRVGEPQVGNPRIYKDTDLQNNNSDDLKPYDLRQEPAYIALVNAVVRVCKRLDPGALAEDDVKIIDTLYSNGVKPDEIVTYYATEHKTERGTPAAWWYRHFWKGRRSQFPTPKDILETVEQARSFKEIQVEGESPAEKGEAEKAWRDVQNWLEGQPVSTLSSRTLDAVRAIGETNLRGMNQYNKTEYKQRFVAQWTRSGNENGHK